MCLKPKSYVFKDSTEASEVRYGLLAQQLKSNMDKHNLEGLIEKYDTRSYKDEGFYTGKDALRINYDDLHAYHIAFAQNCYKKILELENEIKELKQ